MGGGPEKWTGLPGLLGTRILVFEWFQIPWPPHSNIPPFLHPHRGLHRGANYTGGRFSFEFSLGPISPDHFQWEGGGVGIAAFFYKNGFFTGFFPQKTPFLKTFFLQLPALTWKFFSLFFKKGVCFFERQRNACFGFILLFFYHVQGGLVLGTYWTPNVSIREVQLGGGGPFFLRSQQFYFDPSGRKMAIRPPNWNIWTHERTLQCFN